MLVLIFVGYLIYFLVTWRSVRLNIKNLESAISFETGLRLINMKHLIGILCFGIVILFSFAEYKDLVLKLEGINVTELIITLVLCFTAVFVSRRSAKSKELDFYLRTKLNSFDILGYVLIRMVFLFTYEFFFRGIMFFELIEATDLIVAITVVTALYMLIHMFDSKSEFYGALPFGIILCLITYYTRSVWAPFAIHLCLSMGYELVRINRFNQKLITS